MAASHHCIFDIDPWMKSYWLRPNSSNWNSSNRISFIGPLAYFIILMTAHSSSTTLLSRQSPQPEIWVSWWTRTFPWRHTLASSFSHVFTNFSRYKPFAIAIINRLISMRKKLVSCLSLKHGTHQVRTRFSSLCVIQLCVHWQQMSWKFWCFTSVRLCVLGILTFTLKAEQPRWHQTLGFVSQFWLHVPCTVYTNPSGQWNTRLGGPPAVSRWVELNRCDMVSTDKRRGHFGTWSLPSNLVNLISFGRPWHLCSSQKKMVGHPANVTISAQRRLHLCGRTFLTFQFRHVFFILCVCVAAIMQ